jgi:predicted Zn-dependent protease with MMP-like domain
MSSIKKQFDGWVERAIEMTPKRLAKGMRNLVFVVDDRPTREIIKESKLRRGYSLFGYYQGFEKTCWRKIFGTPDKIYVYRRPILEQYKTERARLSQVMKTVWHEISHHFGSDEAGALLAERRMFEKFVAQSQKARSCKREVKKIVRVKKGRRGYKRKSKITFRLDEKAIFRS